MAVVTSFSEDQDFWESNPQLLLVPEFKDLRKADKSRGKTESSLTMWWVAFCYDLDVQNKFRGQPLEEKHLLLGEELMGSESYYQENRKKLDPLIAAYLRMSDSEPKRALRDWEEKMQERRQFIKETKYTLGELGEKGNWVGGTATILDGMMANTPKLFKDYKEILKDLAQEDGEGHVQGGSRESLSDSGEI